MMMMRAPAPGQAKRPSMRIRISTPPGANALDGPKPLLEQEYVRCAFHDPKNAIVKRSTGEPMDEGLMRKTGFLFVSHGLCGPCAKRIDSEIDSIPPLGGPDGFGRLNPNMK